MFIFLLIPPVNGDANVSWAIVFIPIFVLVTIWLSIFIYVLFMNCMSMFMLRKHQLEAVICYCLAVIGAIVALVMFLVSQGQDEESARQSGEIGTSLLLLAEFLFFVGIVKATDVTISLAIERMGSDRPQSLVRSEAGWDIDPTRSFEQYPFIGEIETIRPLPSDEGGQMMLPFCGCCVNMTVMDLLGGGGTSRNPTPPISRDTSRSEFDTLA